MIGGAGDRVRHGLQAELLEAGQEFLVVLMPEDAEHPLGGIAGAAPCDKREDEPGEIGVV